MYIYLSIYLSIYLYIYIILYNYIKIDFIYIKIDLYMLDKVMLGRSAKIETLSKGLHYLKAFNERISEWAHF